MITTHLPKEVRRVIRHHVSINYSLAKKLVNSLTANSTVIPLKYTPDHEEVIDVSIKLVKNEVKHYIFVKNGKENIVSRKQMLDSLATGEYYMMKNN
ncbi:MAG: hypothetical protein CL760_12865 [Chloroflexi bacterium]|nr:hypothetical protein [Chloroflexota bacterium]|tara:strand:- start:49945 stop:50235 length:291 start_codon:yes stop_codon:yes gene_type:complete